MDDVGSQSAFPSLLAVYTRHGHMALLLALVRQAIVVANLPPDASACLVQAVVMRLLDAPAPVPLGYARHIHTRGVV
eukprot:scaffold4252_cov376-Prasinococcus_capsulatus_cf.AAC.4